MLMDALRVLRSKTAAYAFVADVKDEATGGVHTLKSICIFPCWLRSAKRANNADRFPATLIDSISQGAAKSQVQWLL